MPGFINSKDIIYNDNYVTTLKKKIRNLRKHHNENKYISVEDGNIFDEFKKRFEEKAFQETRVSFQ